MGPTGSDNDIVELARSLEDDGCSVHTFETMPVEVTMTKFDMAVLVVTDHDALSLESTDHRIQRILHAAGFLEARLAPDRVCLLVEDAVSELQAPPVTQIRYPTGSPAAGKGELIKFIQAQYPRVQRDLHRQVPIREQAQSTELRVPWAMLIAVGLAALIPIVLVARALSGDDSETATVDGTDIGDGGDGESDGGDPAGPEIADDSAVGSATAESDGTASTDGAPLLGESQDGSTVAGVDPGAGGVDGNGQIESQTGVDGLDSGQSGNGSTSAGGQDLSDGSGSGGDGSGNDGAPRLNPPGSSGGHQDDHSHEGSALDNGSQTQTTTPSNEIGLPSTCIVDTRRQVVIPDSIDCVNGGRLVLEGFNGPWHNEISEIAISTGTTGTIHYETGSGNDELNFGSGNIRLDQSAAQYGVDAITLTFSGEGQHIHLYQKPDRGGATATLFFTLS